MSREELSLSPQQGAKEMRGKEGEGSRDSTTTLPLRTKQQTRDHPWWKLDTDSAHKKLIKQDRDGECVAT